VLSQFQAEKKQGYNGKLTDGEPPREEGQPRPPDLCKVIILKRFHLVSPCSEWFSEAS